MKRFPPFLSDSAGVFSLVLCGALVSAWIGSYARDLRIQWSGQGTLKRVDHFSGLGAFSAQALRGNASCRSS